MQCVRRLKDPSLVSPTAHHLNLAREFASAGKYADAPHESIVAGENIELAYAEEQLRSKGVPPDARMSAILFGEPLGPWSIGVGPDWLLGTDAPDFLLPREVWATVAQFVDGTTIPSFWRWIEPERKRCRWKPLDEILEFSAKHGIVAKSFSIFWGGIGGTPPWFRHLSFGQQMTAIEEWCWTLVGRYRGQVAAWETINEAHDWWFANSMRWTHEQVVDVTRLVSDLTGALDPGTPQVINHSCIWGEYLQGLNDRSWAPGTYLEEMISKGVSFEGIGLQYYNPGRDLMECAANLERFRGLGKLIWITEMGTPSASYGSGVETAQVDPLDGWRGVWSEALQADWCEKWYTIARSRPYLLAMNWWDTADSRAYIYKAGLLDDNMKPKPAFDRLMSLRRKWKPSGSREPCAAASAAG